jgi:hypothetical protein
MPSSTSHQTDGNTRSLGIIVPGNISVSMGLTTWAVLYEGRAIRCFKTEVIIEKPRELFHPL